MGMSIQPQKDADRIIRKSFRKAVQRMDKRRAERHWKRQADLEAAEYFAW